MARKGRKEKYWLGKRQGSDSYYTFWFNAETRQTSRISHGTTDFREAEIAHYKFVIENEKPKNQQPNDALLSTCLMRYYNQHGSKIPSSTMAKVGCGLWLEFFGTDTVADLTIEKQEAFIAWLKGRGYKNAYVSRVISVGRAALNWAWKRQEISSVPFIKDERDRSDAKEAYRLSKDEMSKLLAIAAKRQPSIFMFCMIALNTLARPEAVLDLAPAQVDLEARIIKLNPHGRKQTKKFRPEVPITNTLLPLLQSRSVKRFVHKVDGEPYTTPIKTSFRRLITEAGLSKEITPYSLRHTMAVEMRRRGVPLWELQGYMGHKAGGITETYAKFGPDYLSQGSRAIDAYFADLGAMFADGAPWSLFNVACHDVPAPKVVDFNLADKLLNFNGKMVGGTGIEPVTPTMSR
jgi:integrase